MNTTPRFGRVVRQWRHKKNWNQTELAQAAGIHPSHVSLLESGERGYNPMLETVEALARALDAPLYVFLEAAGKFEPFREFVRNDPLLSAAQRRVLLGTYDAFFRES